MSAFFDLYESLPRQGPGDRATQDFALRLLGVGRRERMLDAGCGIGADIDGLLAWAPKGHVTAVDTLAPFIEKIAARYADDARVQPVAGEMAAQTGPFDLIFCAGALYFLGLAHGLATFRDHLNENGCLIFSHPVYFATSPSREAQAFWEGEGEVLHSDAVCAATRAAGFEIDDAVKVDDAAWLAYYDPLQARVTELRPTANHEMNEALDRAQAEIDGWRSVRSETGYLQLVATRA